jgi:DnaK suppressor protein
MTAPLRASHLSERSVGSPPAVSRSAVRAQLQAQAKIHASTLARCRAELATSSLRNTTDLGRAMNALRMYGAREALEHIEDALSRVEAGTYGICLACDGPIPPEQLEMIPQARFCATCPTPMPTADQDGPGPYLEGG